MHTKGYFFIVDSIIGSTIIFMALMIIISSGQAVSRIQYNYELAEDYGTFIINSKLEDLNNEYINQNDLIENGTLNGKYSVIEAIDKLYYNAAYVCGGSPCNTSNLSIAYNIVKNITDPILANKYGFSYTIIDDIKGQNMTIYNVSTDRLAKTNLIISSRKITFLQINASTLYGPQIVEIKIWI